MRARMSVAPARPARMNNTAPTIDELRGSTAVDMATACRALGIAYNTGRDLAAAGRFPCTVITLPQKRNRYRVPTAELLRLLGIEA